MSTTTRTKAVRVRGVTYLEGYSGYYHFLQNSEFAEMVGRIYPHQKAAREAALALATYGEGRCKTSPISVDLVPADVAPSWDEVIEALEKDGWVGLRSRFNAADFDLYRSEGFWWARHASGPSSKVR